MAEPTLKRVDSTSHLTWMDPIVAFSSLKLVLWVAESRGQGDFQLNGLAAGSFPGSDGQGRVS